MKTANPVAGRSLARRLSRLLVTSAVMLGALVFAAPSYAHDVRIGHPSDPSWTASKHNRGHNWIAVCDDQPDGHLAYSRYELLYDGNSWKPNYLLTGYDDFGNNAQGEYCHWEGHGSVLRDIAICVQYEGCSGWIRVLG
jgi:hypothetical protein